MTLYVFLEFLHIMRAITAVGANITEFLMVTKPTLWG